MKADQVLFEDNHIIVVNKNCGDIVQGDKTGDIPLAEEVALFLKQKYQKPGDAFVGVVHRIDRPVSGLVVFAKTSKALTRMNALFNSKEVKKTYWAVIKGIPPKTEDTLIDFLVRNTEKNTVRVVSQAKVEAKRAELDYKLLCTIDRYSLLEIDLKTGRHHQIRAQLSHIGCSIRGDLKYGYPRSNPDGGINLHARKIEFIHPVKQENLVIEAPLPNEKLWNLISEKWKA